MVSRFWRLHDVARQGRREARYAGISGRPRTQRGGVVLRQKRPDYCRKEHYRPLFTCVWRSPAWPRKVRVGANSPSLCPTICSETNTGTCLRPSWTAIVWPTISGKTVDERDHVRIIRFSLAAFIVSMRLISRSSTNGPFFELRLT